MLLHERGVVPPPPRAQLDASPRDLGAWRLVAGLAADGVNLLRLHRLEMDGTGALAGAQRLEPGGVIDPGLRGALHLDERLAPPATASIQRASVMRASIRSLGRRPAELVPVPEPDLVGLPENRFRREVGHREGEPVGQADVVFRPREDEVVGSEAHGRLELLGGRMKTPGQVDDLHLGVVVHQGLPLDVVEDEELLGAGVVLPQEGMNRLFEQLHAALGRADAGDRGGHRQPVGPAAFRGSAFLGSRDRRRCRGISSRIGTHISSAEALKDALQVLALGQILEGALVVVHDAGEGDHLDRHFVQACLGIGQDGAERLPGLEPESLPGARQPPTQGEGARQDGRVDRRLQRNGAVLGGVDRAAHPQGMLRLGLALIPGKKREPPLALDTLHEAHRPGSVFRKADLDVSGTWTSMPDGFEGARAEEIPASSLRRGLQRGRGAIERIGGDLHVQDLTSARFSSKASRRPRGEPRGRRAGVRCRLSSRPVALSCREI